MCWCTPKIRTPWCGKPGCESPTQASKRITPGDPRVIDALETALARARLGDLSSVIILSANRGTKESTVAFATNDDGGDDKALAGLAEYARATLAERLAS